MSMAGVDLSFTVFAKDTVSSIKWSATKISSQRYPTLPQASIKVSQNLKVFWARASMKRWPSFLNGIEMVQPFDHIMARGHWNFLSIPLTSQQPWCHQNFLSNSSDSSVFSRGKAVIIDIQEKCDGSVLFKFGPPENLQYKDHSLHFLLQGTKNQSRGIFSMALVNLTQPRLQQIGDGTIFSKPCSEDEDEFISLNLKNARRHCFKARANERMFESSPRLEEFGCSRVFLASKSEVSIVDTCSEMLLPWLEETNKRSVFNVSEDTLCDVCENESENICGERVLRSGYLAKNGQPLKSLPSTSLREDVSISALPIAIAKIRMGKVFQLSAFAKRLSECHSATTFQVASDNAFNSRGSVYQGKSMLLVMGTIMTRKPFQSNEGPKHRENSVPYLAATLKHTTSDNVGTVSPNLAPSYPPGRKKQLKKSESRTHPQIRERKRKSNPRDLFCRSPFQVYELLLTRRFTKMSWKDLNYKTVKKACLEIAGVLNQLAIMLAASGIAIILFIASHMLKLNSTFDNGKVAALLRGFSLIWLSSAIQTVRSHVLKFYYGSSTPAQDQIRLLRQEMKSLSVKALTVTALSIIGYVK